MFFGRSMLTVALVALLCAAAQGVSIDNGVYNLASHPDGTENPPPYGLRLDGLLGDNSEEYTYDFSDPLSSMTMTISDSLLFPGTKKVVISGKSFGGLDTGAVYDTELSGLWSIDFSYDNVQVDNPNMELFTLKADAGNNAGTITSLFNSSGAQAGRLSNGDMFNLIDYDGTHDFTFKLKFGHRGVAGLSGFGWLNHAPDGVNIHKVDHIYASDWLFTAEKVPPPPPNIPLPPALPAGLALLGLVVLRQRKA